MGLSASSGLLPDSLCESLSAFACVVEKLHQDRMEEASLNNLLLRALLCGRTGSSPITRCRGTYVCDLIKYTLFCYMHTWIFGDSLQRMQ